MERGCENGLFKANRFGEIVLAEATEVNTEVNTPTVDTFRDLDPHDGTKTPTLPDTAQVSFASTVHLREVPGEAEDGAIRQVMFPSISELPSFRLGDEISASEVPLSLLGETYDNPIPTIEEGEDHSGCGEDSPAMSEGGSPGPPARRLRLGESDWSWTVDLELSSPEGGSTLEDQPAERNEEDLSKLRLVKQSFSSSFGSSFSNRERSVSANPDVAI